MINTVKREPDSIQKEDLKTDIMLFKDEIDTPSHDIEFSIIT